MEQIQNLIKNLEQCIPGLDTTRLYADLPVRIEAGAILDWLYKHLSVQSLMVYEEWKEYTGYTPELKPLANLSFPTQPADFIFSLIEGIDWSTASIEPWELPYIMPWLEHINFYLKPNGLRLVDILPFENAYIICLRDDEELLQKLHSSLEVIGMGIDTRPPMDQQQLSTYIQKLGIC